MRLAIYERHIEIRDGKEKLWRDIRMGGNPRSIEEAHEIAEAYFNRGVAIREQLPQINPKVTGINFKIKDLDSKTVIEIFELRY